MAYEHLYDGRRSSQERQFQLSSPGAAKPGVLPFCLDKDPVAIYESQPYEYWHEQLNLW